MTVCVSGTGPQYSLRIALVNKARRAVSVFGTQITSSGGDSSARRTISFVDAPLSRAVLSSVAEGEALPETIVATATAAANLPPQHDRYQLHGRASDRRCLVAYCSLVCCPPYAE